MLCPVHSRVGRGNRPQPWESSVKTVRIVIYTLLKYYNNIF